MLPDGSGAPLRCYFADMSQSIVFLTYLSRSGSTYLSSKLSEYADIGVGIEADFVDGWITPGFCIKSQKELGAYLDRLYESYKFCQWNVDRALLEKQVQEYGTPLDFSQLLTGALSLYFKGASCPVMVHKGGHYYRAINSIRKEMPTARFIFVDRDPRAIFSSMKKSLDSKTNRPMLEDVLHFAFGYLDTQERIKQFANESFFHLVRYENLLKNESEEIEKLVRFLGVRRKKKEQDSRYFDVVPDAQKHLHRNIRSGRPKMNRIDGWKSELDAVDVNFLEISLRQYILANGYSLSGISPDTIQGRGQLVTNLMKFGYELSKRKFFFLPHKY